MKAVLGQIDLEWPLLLPIKGLFFYHNQLSFLYITSPPNPSTTTTIDDKLLHYAQHIPTPSSRRSCFASR